MGIDVLAVHPSPVASNFFDKAHKLESLEMAQKAAVLPGSVPAKMLSCVGRAHLGDLGEMAVGVRICSCPLLFSVPLTPLSVVALLPYDFLTGLFSYFAPYMGDYQKYNKVTTAAQMIVSPLLPISESRCRSTGQVEKKKGSSEVDSFTWDQL
jgi:hypothetical protein